tara:strand:+ start:5242 stop:5877 length:636 start_codon:yes stop_codon:yes gene_type:complete
MDKNKIIILGCGSQAIYALEILLQQNREVSVFVNLESGATTYTNINKIPVLENLSTLSDFDTQTHSVIVGHGNNEIKKNASEFAESIGFTQVTAISNNSYVSPLAQVSHGTIINPNVSIMHGAKIGRDVIIHSGSIIEHDCVIGDYSNIGPGVALGGRVTVGESSYLYTGSKVIPNITIGNKSKIGAGTVVIKNVKSHTTIVGNPGRELST